ncbi:uncharacterized protein [Ptychodera flava]|uniref:uncharacterized protein isoform X1 n=1 Tax=Ptychodera flava TaxID=63121 RepID=UPI00396A04B1
MKTLLLAAFVLQILQSVRSSDNVTYEIDTTPQEDTAIVADDRTQCLMCDVIIDKDHACITKANNSIGSQVSLVYCDGSCFVEKTTIVGFTLMFKRGCIAKCVEDDACNGMIMSGKCIRCCDHNYCNADLGLSAAPQVSSSALLSFVGFILVLIRLH